MYLTHFLGKGEIQRVVLVESAIDALSFATLDKTNYKENKTVYLSADGAGAIPTKDLQAVLERGGQVIVGFDADQAGEQMAWKVAQSLPGVTRLQPNRGKDWNEQLLGNNKPSVSVDNPVEWSRIAKALGKPENYINRVTDVVTAFKSGQPLSEKATTAMRSDRDAYKQSMDSLWKWHSIANTLGKSSQYLSRIAEVALVFNADKPTPLSAEAVATMQRDRNIFQVVDTSQKVLQHLGKPTGNANGELLFRGKNFYQVKGVQNDFRLDCYDRGLILAVSQGRVQKADLTNDDFDRFRALGQKLQVGVVKLGEISAGKKFSKNCDLEVSS
ncbi:MAG: toprim domain-containing protein [Gloeocapsa sp. UFS-A4-WI-NPMV-4B04]|jgi:5S rRNA maturation endonuclease (ribonuclease M5)|nr:toprim domain-containing protein [Gloeocapsa sp. UFS-A4-WI-NPMV-4B04]